MKHKYYSKSGGRFKKKRTLRLLGVFSIGVGVLVLAYFFFPLFSYNLFLTDALANNGSNIEVPVPKYTLATSNRFGSMLAAGVNSVVTDYTDARNWYPGVSSNVSAETVGSYLLSIPSIEVKNALVSAVDFDLSKHLVQYYGTTTPPNNGSTVIYGHSTLPQLYDPKDYTTVFANLHKIEIGDDIVLTINGVPYTYQVSSKHVMDPDDINIFEQKYDDSYVALVTCTPPGTVWKRLVVRARLVPLEKNG